MIIIGALQGKAKLWPLFWLWGPLFLTALTLSLSLLFYKKIITETGMYSIFAVYFVWWLVAVWRCASNCSKTIWTNLARAYVIFVPLAIVGFIKGANGFLKINYECNQLHLKRAQSQDLTWDAYYKDHAKELSECKNLGWAGGVVQ